MRPSETQPSSSENLSMMAVHRGANLFHVAPAVGLAHFAKLNLNGIRLVEEVSRRNNTVQHHPHRLDGGAAPPQMSNVRGQPQEPPLPLPHAWRPWLFQPCWCASPAGFFFRRPRTDSSSAASASSFFKLLRLARGIEQVEILKLIASRNEGLRCPFAHPYQSPACHFRAGARRGA